MAMPNRRDDIQTTARMNQACIVVLVYEYYSPSAGYADQYFGACPPHKVHIPLCSVKFRGTDGAQE